MSGVILTSHQCFIQDYFGLGLITSKGINYAPSYLQVVPPGYLGDGCAAVAINTGWSQLGKSPKEDQLRKTEADQVNRTDQKDKKPTKRSSVKF